MRMKSFWLGFRAHSKLSCFPPKEALDVLQESRSQWLKQSAPPGCMWSWMPHRVLTSHAGGISATVQCSSRFRPCSQIPKQSHFWAGTWQPHSFQLALPVQWRPWLDLLPRRKPIGEPVSWMGGGGYSALLVWTGILCWHDKLLQSWSLSIPPCPFIPYTVFPSLGVETLWDVEGVAGDVSAAADGLAVPTQGGHGASDSCSGHGQPPCCPILPTCMPSWGRFAFLLQSHSQRRYWFICFLQKGQVERKA